MSDISNHDGDTDATAAADPRARGVATPRDRTTDTAHEDISEWGRDELIALVTDLRSENERLREEAIRARRADYRQSAAALVVLGLLGVIGGLTLSRAQEILFILGAIGLFSGTLTWFLTPERFVTATVGESIYDAVAATGTRLRDELGLQKTNVYVPVGGSDDDPPARLFVPQLQSFELPTNPRSLFVSAESPEQRGVSVRPTAATLVAEFTSSAALEDDPTLLAGQLAEALVEQFELVDTADPEVDTSSRRITVSVEGSAYNNVTGFDHPVTSFLGTALADGLDRSVVVETTVVDGRILVTCRWSLSTDEADGQPDEKTE